MEWTAARLRRHLLEELLPYWAERGVDRVHGGFHNRLDDEGRPLPEASKRLLVQTRQIYVFSEAARMGAPFGLPLATQGVAFLERAFRDRRHGGWFHTATPEGEPLDRRKDCYGHAFVVFALARYHAASGDAAALARARDTAELALARLRDDAGGGYREAADEDWTPRAELPRRQNPHMHWLEALLALHAEAPDAALLAEAERLLELLRARWLDAERGCLGEFFAADWRPAAAPEGDVVEPGHHYEWSWLLARHAERAGLAAHPEGETLFAFAERHGTDGAGGVFDRIDRRGRVLADTQRLWPQTERLKALAARGARDALAAALPRVFSRYARAGGGWTEQVGRDGKPTGGIQNATSVYHVVLALCEAMEAL
jgi:mannose-6-phosphate isomerase